MSFQNNDFVGGLRERTDSRLWSGSVNKNVEKVLYFGSRERSSFESPQMILGF
jgi:hypothetical protein